MGKKKLLGRVLAITLMLSLIFSITACGTQQTALNSAASDATRNEIKEVTITDHLGREVSISGDVERIVSGYYISTSMLIALGLEDKVWRHKQNQDRFIRLPHRKFWIFLMWARRSNLIWKDAWPLSLIL